MWSDTFLKNLKPKEKPYFETQPGGARGVGRLMVKVATTGRKTFYFRYILSGKERKMLLGDYPTMTLKAARDRFDELSEIHQEHGDVKAWLAQQDAKKLEVERKTNAVPTFEEMLEWYFDMLDKKGKGSADRYREDYLRNINPNKRVLSKNKRGSRLKHAPDQLDRLREILSKKANQITPEDINTILKPMVDRGVQRGVNYTRTYINAAFSAALMADHNPRHGDTERKFELQINPCSLVQKISEFEKVGERALGRDEIKLFWELSIRHMAFRPARFLRLAFLLGGQRPTVEMRYLHWDEIDLNERVISFPITRTKLRMPHLVPINDLAMNELLIIRELSHADGYVFPWVRSNRMIKDEPPSKDIIGNNLRDLCRSPEWPYAEFNATDLRRTATTHMGAAGVSHEARERLQGRTFQDTGSRHYDKYHHLEMKREAAEQWNDYLMNLLFPGEQNRLQRLLPGNFQDL